MYEAFLLVIIIIFLFLRDWRVTLIPVSYTHLDVYKRQAVMYLEEALAHIRAGKASTQKAYRLMNIRYA